MKKRRQAEADVSAPLNSEEVAVLMIAAAGNSMMAIGRWERAVKGLSRRGFLHMQDEVNYVITDAGREALAKAERMLQEEFNATALRARDAVVI